MNHRENMRLLILQVLAKQPQYVANQEVIIKELRSQGYVLSRDMLHIELSWLENNANAIVDTVTGGVHIATLTNDGFEIADGTVVMPGIMRPIPVSLR